MATWRVIVKHDSASQTDDELKDISRRGGSDDLLVAAMIDTLLYGGLYLRLASLDLGAHVAKASGIS